MLNKKHRSTSVLRSGDHRCVVDFKVRDAPTGDSARSLDRSI